MTRVPQMLTEAAEIYEERNELYGDNYKRHGRVMAAMFPRGISVTSVSGHNRMGILVQIVAKITRYAENFEKGGHEDSLKDLAVYSQMLRELDEIDRANEGVPF